MSLGLEFVSFLLSPALHPGLVLFLLSLHKAGLTSMCVPLHVTKHFECCKITKPKKCAGAYTRLDRTNSIAQHRDPRIHTRKRLYQSANLPSKKAISNDGTTRYALLSRSLSRNVVCIEKTGSYSSVLYVNTRSLIK